MAANQIGHEAALKALKQHALARPHLENPGRLFDTYDKETDRGGVILIATALEDRLETAIRSKMIDLSADEAARLFGPDAPLGSFSAKIRLAHALKILDKKTTKLFDLLRAMRNACAHSRDDITFADPALADPVALLVAAMDPDDAIAEAPPRWGFVICAAYLVHAINCRCAKPPRAIYREMHETAARFLEAERRTNEGSGNLPR